MLPLYMNGRLIQSAAQLRAHFSAEDMLRSRRAFAAVTRQALMQLSDEMRCACLIFTLTTLHTHHQLHHLDVASLGLPSIEEFIGLDAFEQLHTALDENDLPNTLCDVYMQLSFSLLNEKSTIIYWTNSGTDKLLMQLADVAVQTQLTGRALLDFYLLLASGCLLADVKDTTALRPQPLRCAFLGVQDTPPTASSAWHALGSGQYIPFPQQAAPYRLKTFDDTSLPEGAYLRAVCLQGETHLQSSTQYQSQLCFHSVLDAPELLVLMLSPQDCVWCTAVYTQENVFSGLILPQEEDIPASTHAVRILRNGQDGELRLLPDGSLDSDLYKNAEHRYFIESIRDESFVDMRLHGSELLLLTAQGEVYTSTGRTYASVPSLDCLNARKD